MKKLSLLLIACIATGTLFAKVELPTVLSSGMVMQRECDANVWGKAKSGAKITVTTSWDKASKSTTAGSDGSWLVKVSTPQAGGPYSIKISDGEAITLDNVMIGEVWVCSGQSNMEMPVIGFRNQPTDGSAQAIINARTENNIRMYSVKRETSATPQNNCTGNWSESTPQSVASFSATAYFFALNISRALGNVPIGVINTSWGGTMIQPWMPAECSQRVMDDKYLSTNLSDKSENRRMGYLYNAMIYPIRNFVARGFLWYQGESNKSDTGIGKNGTKVYANLMQEMVAQWRKDWGDATNSMPFFYVQIAPFNYDGADQIVRPLLVESQVDALKLIPNSGMAATTDIGNPTCIHPAQKDKVGERLALLAIANTYKSQSLPVNFAPLKNVTYSEGKAIVEFEATQSGINSPDRELKGFELCGEDKVFYAAKARIASGNNTVEVSCEKVSKPIAVRFGYRNYIEVNLFNALGIPPYSFRTDNF